MSGFSESPDAIGEMLDQFEAQASEGTSKTPPSDPQAQPPSNQKPVVPANKPAPMATGTTEQKPLDAAATANQTPAQSPIPKELEAYKPLIESKKWDVSKPDWIAQPLKSLQEAEQFNGRITTDLGLTRNRVEEVGQTLLGSPEQINDHRQRMGYPTLPFEKSSVADKLKEAEGEREIFERMLSQDPNESAKAIGEFQARLSKRLEDLRFRDRFESMQPKGKQDSDIPTDFKRNMMDLFGKFQDAGEKFNALVPYLKTPHGSGILGSFGMDIFNIHSSPQRSQAVYELATKIHLADNFESEVDRRVKQVLADNQTRSNASAIQGQGATGHTQNQAEENPLEDHLSAFSRR